MHFRCCRLMEMKFSVLILHFLRMQQLERTTWTCVVSMHCSNWKLAAWKSYFLTDSCRNFWFASFLWQKYIVLNLHCPFVYLHIHAVSFELYSSKHCAYFTVCTYRVFSLKEYKVKKCFSVMMLTGCSMLSVLV